MISKPKTRRLSGKKRNKSNVPKSMGPKKWWHYNKDNIKEVAKKLEGKKLMDDGLNSGQIISTCIMYDTIWVKVYTQGGCLEFPIHNEELDRMLRS